MDELIVQKVADLARDAITIQWQAQGHNLTGKAVRDLETRIVQTAQGFLVLGYVNDYMAYLNTGVTAARIPYSPGSGARTSRYISGLQTYVKLRMGKSDKEALSIAFAIASKHKREGMPTRASARYSNTGKRTGFIDEALDSKEDEMGELITAGVAEAFTVVIENLIQSVLKR
jgi:hypothetical protein